VYRTPIKGGLQDVVSRELRSDTRCCGLAEALSWLAISAVIVISGDDWRWVVVSAQRGYAPIGPYRQSGLASLIERLHVRSGSDGGGVAGA
jgi:hypothetical protein